MTDELERTRLDLLLCQERCRDLGRRLAEQAEANRTDAALDAVREIRNLRAEVRQLREELKILFESVENWEELAEARRETILFLSDVEAENEWWRTGGLTGRKPRNA